MHMYRCICVYACMYIHTNRHIHTHRHISKRGLITWFLYACMTSAGWFMVSELSTHALHECVVCMCWFMSLTDIAKQDPIVSSPHEQKASANSRHSYRYVKNMHTNTDLTAASLHRWKASANAQSPHCPHRSFHAPNHLRWHQLPVTYIVHQCLDNHGFPHIVIGLLREVIFVAIKSQWQTMHICMWCICPYIYIHIYKKFLLLQPEPMHTLTCRPYIQCPNTCK